nr:putative glycosidase crf1 [Quercus suber]
MRFTKTSAAAIVAALPLTLAQTSTDCNPTEKTCPSDVGLNAATYSADFTQSNANASWTAADGTTITYGSQGAEFSIDSSSDAPTFSTDFYFLFGRVDVKMKASTGTGIVSSVVLESDDLDEIDWEWLGGDSAQVQTNFFGKGNTTSYDRGTYQAVSTPQTTFHTYSFDWTADRLQWLIDGTVVRTLNYDDALALNGKNYPQTPMRLKLGSWCGGCSSSEGTVSWAGGETTFDDAPYVMYVETVAITNYNPATSYEYSDMTGDWQSITINKGSDTSSVSDSSSSDADTATASATAASSTVSVIGSATLTTSVDTTATVAPTSMIAVTGLQDHSGVVQSTTIIGSSYSTNTASIVAQNSGTTLTTSVGNTGVTTQRQSATLSTSTNTSSFTSASVTSATPTTNGASTMHQSFATGALLTVALAWFMILHLVRGGLFQSYTTSLSATSSQSIGTVFAYSHDGGNQKLFTDVLRRPRASGALCRPRQRQEGISYTYYCIIVMHETHGTHGGVCSHFDVRPAVDDESTSPGCPYIPCGANGGEVRLFLLAWLILPVLPYISWPQKIACATMSSQQFPGNASRSCYSHGSEGGWDSNSISLTANDPDYQQEDHSWQQLQTASNFNLSDIDSFLGARPKRGLQHASWNQEALIPVSSQLVHPSWQSQHRRRYSAAKTEPYLVNRPSGSSVTTGDSGYGSHVSLSRPSDQSFWTYQQLPLLKNPAPSRQVGYQLQPLDSAQSVASEPRLNLITASKHKLQHEKPFLCVEDGCNRTQGFATKNDLERHRKTVHHKEPRVGKIERFVCAGCPSPQQGSTTKVWLRRDNFKAHIQRKHTDYPEELLIERSQLLNTTDATSVSGYESMADANRHDLANTSLQLTDESTAYEEYGSNNDYRQGDYSFAFGNRHQNDGLAGIGYGAVTDAGSNRALEMDVSLWRTEQRKGSESQYKMRRTMSPITVPDERSLHSTFAPVLEITQAGNAGDPHTNSHPGSQNRSKDHLAIPSFGTSFGSSSSSGSDLGDGDFVCPECGKRKLRECDLTRNDWNRHEFSQHVDAEMWRCRLPRSDRQICGKVYYTADDMRTHLRSLEHTQSLFGRVDDEVKRGNCGPYGRANFWCGFCNTLIPTTPKEGLASWAARSKHIGDHYDKDNRKIEDWVCVKENRPKRYVVQRKEKKGVKLDFRKAFDKYGSATSILEDDSDLGDDGIPLQKPAGHGGG